MELESKALSGPAESREVKEAFDEFRRTIESYKAENDERLQKLERRSEDVVTNEKVDRINQAVTEQKRLVEEMILANQRPQLGGQTLQTGDTREHKSAFERYVRKGDAGGLAPFEIKSLSSQSDPDGGYLVPRETETAIDRVLAKVSPIRAIATVRQIGAQSYRKPVTTTGADAGWVGEVASRTETAAPNLSVVEFPTMELYAMPAATQSLLDDAFINIEQWLAEEVQTTFGEQEGAAFINGDGINRPRGLLSYTVVADASWAWNKLGYIASGGAGAFASSNPSDALVDLVYAPRQSYRANGRWVMNRKTEAAIRKLKDGQGNYIWQPGASAGDPATLLGYPVNQAEDMPDIGANTYSIAFGDFARGYLVIDRVGVRVLRDPYSAKPFVLFYTTKRVGGGVQNFEAIKLMKFAVS
ncbi:MAG TPA: phage major capsid protein [Micropepsaceae bacterium]|nr:phage major capsid protein [Micropepsaceae bacterium]